MIDAFVILTPFLLLGVIVLLGFVGCTTFSTAAEPGTLSLTANPTSINEGATSTLTWAVTNANSASITANPADGPDIGVVYTADPMNPAKPTTGTSTVSPKAMTTYTLSGLDTDSKPINPPATATVTVVGPMPPPPPVPVGPIQFVQVQANSQTANPPISVMINGTKAGNLLIAAVSYGGPATGSVTVTATPGGNMTLVGSGPWFRQSRVFFLPNIPGGNVTITATGVGGATGPCSICVSEYSGTDLTAAAVYGFSTKASPSTGTPGTEPISGAALSLAKPSDLAYVVAFASTTTAFSPGAGFTQHPSPITSLLVEDSANSIKAADMIAIINGGAGFVPWVVLVVGIKA